MSSFLGCPETGRRTPPRKTRGVGRDFEASSDFAAHLTMRNSIEYLVVLRDPLIFGMQPEEDAGGITAFVRLATDYHRGKSGTEASASSWVLAAAVLHGRRPTHNLPDPAPEPAGGLRLVGPDRLEDLQHAYAIVRLPQGVSSILVRCSTEVSGGACSLLRTCLSCSDRRPNGSPLRATGGRIHGRPDEPVTTLPAQLGEVRT